MARSRWAAPLVHSAHTLAKVKNAALADGDRPEPLARLVGEDRVAAEADRLIASTADEAHQLRRLYGARADQVVTVPPGVDLELFRMADASAARTRLGVPPDAVLLLFVGRIQPLKAPDLLLRAVPPLLERMPELRGRLQVAIVGGPSGTGLDRPESLHKLAAALGIADLVRFEPPARAARLADWYRGRRRHRRAEPQRVVRAGRAGVPGVRHPGRRRRGRRAAHRGPGRGVRPAGRLPPTRPTSPPRSAGWSPPPGCGPGWAARRRRHAERFSWQRTAEGLLVAYRGALADRRDRPARRPRWEDHDGPSRAELDEVIRTTLVDRELEHRAHRRGVVPGHACPGTHRLATPCWLVVGDHALLVEAFVMRHADEDKAELYDFLLQRNSRMYGVAFSLDRDGDVYLVGRLPLAAVTPDEIDRLLGAVLTYADENFDTMLRLGFGDSIKREWAWRVKRGESLANLRAFARFADPESGPDTFDTLLLRIEKWLVASADVDRETIQARRWWILGVLVVSLLVVSSTTRSSTWR